MSEKWYDSLPKYYQRQIARMGLDEKGLARRRFLKAAAAVAGVAAVGLPAGKARAASGSLSYMCWEGYDDSQIISPFNEANDTKIAFDLIVDSPGGFAKLMAGASREIDVVSTDLPWITRMGPAGIALPLDPAEFADVYETFYDPFKPPFSPLEHDGQAFGITSRWGWIGPCINLDNTSEAEWSSYDPAFDPANRDKICVMDWGDWPIMPMALHAGINPYKELDDHELSEIRKVLRSLFKNTRTIVGDASLAQRGLLDGSLTGCIGAGSYLTSALRKQGNRNIKAVTPEAKDGLKQGIVWLEATAILNETDEPELAKALVKHLVSEDSGKKLSLLDSTCNLVPNSLVERTYTEDERDILQADYMWHAWENSHMHAIAPNVDEMLQIWQEELAAAN